MSIFIQSTSDLRKGEDAVATTFSKPADTFFNSMLMSDEVFHYGFAITKRPALKLISFWGYEKDFVTIDNNNIIFLENFKPLIPIPANVLTKDISNDLLISSSQQTARVGQGEFTQTIDLFPNGIDRIEKDGDYFNVFPIGSTTGIVVDNIQYSVFFNGQIHDFIVADNSNSISGYFRFRPFLRNYDTYITNEYSIVKTFNNSSVRIPKTADFLFFGDRIIFTTPDNAYGILPNSETVVDENAIFRGKSITTLGNLIITVKEMTATGIPEFQRYIQINVTNPNRANPTDNVTFTTSPIELSARYGIRPYWIRRSFSDRGLVLASDTGIYIINLTNDAKAIDSIISLTNYRVADVYPAEYREFLFYVTASKRGLDYIRYEKFYLNAVSDSLQSLEHLLQIDDEIIKIEKLIWHDAPILFVLTKFGDVISVNLYLNQLGGMSALYSKCFVDYKVYDLCVSQGGVGGLPKLKENPEELLYVLLARKEERISTIFSAMLAITDLPDYREKRETRKPCVDLYTYISTENMFFKKIENNQIVSIIKPKLRITKNTNNSWNIVSLGDGFFKQRMVGTKIIVKSMSISIVSVVDEHTAIGFVHNMSPAQEQLAEFVIDDYTIELSRLYGYSYLHYLSQERKIIENDPCSTEINPFDEHLYSGDRIVGMSSNYATILFTRKIADNVALIENFSHAEDAYVGFPYMMKWITTPLVTNRWFVSTKSRTKVATEIIGWKKSHLFSSFLGHEKNSLVSGAISVGADYTEDVDQYIRHAEFTLPHYNSSRMSICFLSEDMVPLYLTAFGILCQEHTE